MKDLRLFAITLLLLCVFYSCGVILGYVRTRKHMIEDTKIFLISNGLGFYDTNETTKKPEFKTTCTNNIPAWLK